MKKINLLFGIWLVVTSTLAQDPISGAEIYNLNCARCHQARPTHEFSDREWDVIVPHMRERAHLTRSESNALTAFLQMSNLPETLQTMPANNESESPETGKQLATQFACVGCHVIENTGGKIGPSLDDIFSRQDESFIFQKLTNPQFNNPASPMPKFPLTKEQIKAIVSYLKSVQK